jgi:hypothetical protein
MGKRRMDGWGTGTRESREDVLVRAGRLTVKGR